MSRGNPWGVCARQRRSRETVLLIRFPATTSFTVSFSGTAATAPLPARAVAITASIVSRVTNGRAPSCTSTTTARSGRAERAARTDCARVAPPATSASRSPTSFPSHSGGRAANPAGTATATRPTSGCEVNGRRARSSIGTPQIGRNGFGSPGPARTPAPAATITTPTSGREPPSELTDPFHPDDLEVGRRHAGARRQEHAPEPLARRLPEPPLHARHRADLTAQPDLAQE